MKKLFTFIFVLLMYLGANGQPNIQWQKSLGGTNHDEAYSIRQTMDGGYIAAGRSYSNNGDVTGHHGTAHYDYWIVKLDVTGNIQWEKSLGGTQDDEAFAIRQTPDRGYIIAGSSESYDGDAPINIGYQDYWIVKTDSSGTIQWQKKHGGGSIDMAQSIELTIDGGYIVAGYTHSNDGDVTGNHPSGFGFYFDFWLVKLDTAGNIQWQKPYGGTNHEYAYSVKQTTDGGFIIAGSARSNNGDVTGHHADSLNLDSWIVKVDTAGTIQWQKSLGGTGNEEAHSILQTTDGGYIVAGGTASYDGDVISNHGLSSSDYWILKLDNTGTIQWQKCLGGGNNDVAYSISKTIDGGYIVAGYSHSSDGDVTNNNLGYEGYWVVKIDTIGTIQWDKFIVGGGSDGAYSIQQTTEGGYIVAGGWQGAGCHGGYDYGIIKLNCATPIASQNLIICTGQSVTVGTNTYTTAGTFTDYFTSAAGCDSSHITHLSVLQDSVTIAAIACDSIVVNAQSYYATGNYYQALSNFLGCDSILRINFTNLPDTVTLSRSACDSIHINSQIYYTTGTYYQTLTNILGCDSILVINFTYSLPPIINIGNDTTICANYHFTLNAPLGMSSYSWNSSTGGSSTSNSFSDLPDWIDNPTIITCTITNNIGCTASDTVNIYTMPASATVTCTSSGAILVADPGYVSYQWSSFGFLSTNQTITVTTPDQYDLVETDASGCVHLGTYNVNPFTGPVSTYFTYTLISGFTYDFYSPFSMSYGYYWDFGDATNANTQHVVHTFPGNGNYIITLVVSNLCGSDSSNQTINIGGSQVSENNYNSSIIIFPNPANNELKIKNAELKIESVSIYNILGELVLSSKLVIGKSEEAVNVSALHSGIYFMEVVSKGSTTGNRIVRKKFIKE